MKNIYAIKNINLIGLKIAKNTTDYQNYRRISLIILKNFADLVFVKFFRATRHLPK